MAGVGAEARVFRNYPSPAASEIVLNCIWGVGFNSPYCDSSGLLYGSVQLETQLRRTILRGVYRLYLRCPDTSVVLRSVECIWPPAAVCDRAVKEVFPSSGSRCRGKCSHRDCSECFHRTVCWCREQNVSRGIRHALLKMFKSLRDAPPVHQWEQLWTSTLGPARACL